MDILVIMNNYQAFSSVKLLLWNGCSQVLTMACIGERSVVGQQRELYPSILEEAKWTGTSSIHFP